MSTSAPTARPYQVYLYVGAAAPSLPGSRVVDLTPAVSTAEAVLTALTASGLTPADLRSKVLFVTDSPAHQDAAILTYAALLGFAKRRLDVAFGLTGAPLDMAALDALMRRQPDAGRPETPAAQIQVGGPARTDLPQFDITPGIPPETLSAIRYAKRVRFCPPSRPDLALPQLVAIAAVRGRGAVERLPYLTDGTEPAPQADDPSAVAGVCLNTLARSAETLRRSLRADNREAIADKAELTPRQQRLVAAAATPLSEALVKLGAKAATLPPADPDGEPTEVWHCPCPQNHTNGDATPSARILESADAPSGFRCYRCLQEKVDALRLVMWARQLTADEAADWLLG